ncbi:hypothetical protein GJAV_G00274910 [Gymnothorax javanicus]|nr:hypothetical protein GJAV_G00274910 [Gymnothorax javanicus]
MFTLLFTNHFLTDLAVCLGSLSCWKIHSCPRLSYSPDCLMFSLRICISWSYFMMPLTLTRFPGPFAEKKPQRMILLLPCLTVGTVFSRLNASPFVRQTKAPSLCLNSSIFVSSIHNIGSQNLHPDDSWVGPDIDFVDLPKNHTYLL